jgi:3',5'-cyclic AMP phosphodiesterase CpdA
MAKYEVLVDTLGAIPTYSKGDIIEDDGARKPPFDFGWLEEQGAIKKLNRRDLAAREAEPVEEPASPAAGPDMVVPPGEAPPAPPDPLAFLSDEQRAALTAAGYGTPEAIRGATDEQLDAVPGIGEATVQKLREATRG